MEQARGGCGEGDGSRGLPALVLLLAGAFVLGGACSSQAAKADGGTADAREGVGGSSGVGGQGIDGAPPPDLPSSTPDGFTFPDPPPVSCSGTGGAAGGCDFPPPNCTNIVPDLCDQEGRCAGGEWIVYYDNPRCVGGRCVYDQRFYDCGATSTCVRGGCRFNGTAIP